jgi:hypothetical protein
VAAVCLRTMSGRVLDLSPNRQQKENVVL